MPEIVNGALIMWPDTNVKPFKCFTCHMSFARRDLLQRHYTVHGRDQNQEPLPTSNGMIPKSAGRTPIACSNCAKTKTKCDKKFPCSRCAGRNLKCTLRPTRRTTKNAARIGIPPEGAAMLPPGMQVSGADNSLQALDTKATTSPTEPVGLLKSSSPNASLMASIPENQQLSLVVKGPPQHFLEHSTSGPLSAMSSSNTTYSPPMQTPGFAQTTPFSTGFDGLVATGKNLPDDMTSPRFMLDWSQIQMPIGYDMGQPSMIMSAADLGFDPTGLSLGPTHEGMFSMLPGLTAGMPPFAHPPEPTPRADSAFSDLGVSSSAVGQLPAAPQRNHSMPSSVSSVPETHGGEIAAIVAGRDAWTVFRCMPILPATSCPRTARLNLERLEQTLRNQQSWSTWSPQWDDCDLAAGGDHLTVMQLHESSRDKLLAITQSFLHKALEIHRDGGSHLASGSSSGGSANGSENGASNFVLLPPTRVLEYFLRAYANCFERYYPLTSRGTLDANELMHCYNDRAACLLVLMMIAQGAMSISSTEARMLTGGLTEACRISLFDLIEKDIIMAGDPVVLHAALLFTTQAAWSGDKWQMDIAMGQRGMYLAMLRHSAFLEPKPPPASNNSDKQRDTDQLWSEWVQNEARSRLVYSWAMVDQETALFHDTMPLFTTTDFAVPMPDAERLWQAKTAAEWSAIFEQVHEFSGGYSSLGSGARPLSLRDLFRHFLDNEMIALGIETTPLQLRLLLHPLQSLVCQYSQLLTCFSDPLSIRGSTTVLPSSPHTPSAASTRKRIEETQSLLRRWFDLAERYLKANANCEVMQTNLLLFHLISLNAVTSFADIERLARRDGFDGSYSQLIWLHKRCILDVEEATFHCGQVLRVVREMPRAARPPWWAGAVYRVALVLWTDSLLHKDPSSPNVSSNSNSNGSTNTGSSGNSVAIASGSNSGPVSSSSSGTSRRSISSSSSSGSTGTASGMFRVPGPSFAIDALSADHPLILRYLTKREGVPCVTKHDGSQMSLDHAFAVLQHAVELIDDGAASRFSDGIRAKLDRLSRG